jgi:DsbC/DsbD-like thiol-disulfide interchange protein
VEKGLGTFQIYEGQVSIPVVVQRPAGDTGPLEVSVRYQACDPKRCLPPATAKVTVK